MYCKECGEKVDDPEAHDAISDHPFVEAIPDDATVTRDTDPQFWWDRLPWIIKIPIAPFVMVSLLLISLVAGMILLVSTLLQGILFLILLLWAAIKLLWITDWEQTLRQHKYTKKDKYRASFM